MVGSPFASGIYCMMRMSKHSIHKCSHSAFLTVGVNTMSDENENQEQEYRDNTESRENEVSDNIAGKLIFFVLAIAVIIALKSIL